MDHTFLFTDIEASTLLWEEHPEEMATALERHDSMLGSAIADSGGVVLKTTGDGVHAVFDSAMDAVAASLEMQRALSASDWWSSRQPLASSPCAGSSVSSPMEAIGWRRCTPPSSRVTRNPT